MLSSARLRLEFRGIRSLSLDSRKVRVSRRNSLREMQPNMVPLWHLLVGSLARLEPVSTTVVTLLALPASSAQVIPIPTFPGKGSRGQRGCSPRSAVMLRCDATQTCLIRLIRTKSNKPRNSCRDLSPKSDRVWVSNAHPIRFNDSNHARTSPRARFVPIRCWHDS